jgi:hypothetical protein
VSVIGASLGFGSAVLPKKSVGGVAKLLPHAAKPCLEASLLGGGEVIGDGEVGEAQQSVPDALETLLEPGGVFGGCGAGSGFGPDPTEGCLKKLAAVGLVGHPVCREQHQSLAMLEPMPLDGAQQGILIFVGQSAEGVGQAGTQESLSEFVLGGGGQAGPELDAAGHPVGLALKTSGDGFETELFLVEKRADDASLVESGEGSAGRIGHQEPLLVFFGGTRTLEHDRDRDLPLLAKALQSLKTIDHFVVSIRGRNHPDRQRGEIAGNCC